MTLPKPQFPPVYQPVKLEPTADAFAEATTAAARGAEDGSLIWTDRRDRFDCALVLTPEAPLAASLQIAYVTLVAVGDALGALAPPIVPITYGWPDRLLINGGVAGRLQVACPEPTDAGSVPPWMVVRMQIAMRGRPNDRAPGREVDRTNLAEEGCGAIEVSDLLESFSRHFLSWVNRWQEAGFMPVREAWLERAIELRNGARVSLPNVDEGEFVALDPNGSLVLRRGKTERIVDLASALKPTAYSR